jgi:RimJ/RimL family protein N-acetyltransferase
VVEAGHRRHEAGSVLRPAYPLRTARLVLRPFSPEDLDDLFDIQSRPEVARFLYWDARDVEQVREALDLKTRESALDEEGGRLSLAVVLPQRGTVIGEVMLRWLSREHRQGEIGFMFHPDHQGRGYATEAAAALLRLGFADLGLHRIIGRCDAQNLPSARVLERLGMRREAHFIHAEIFKGEWGEELVYAMLDHEWKARQAQAPGR